MEYLSTTYDFCVNLEDYKPIKKSPNINWWYDRTYEADKKLCPIVPELFLRGRKLNITLVFMSQFCFKIPTSIRTNVTHYHETI